MRKLFTFLLLAFAAFAQSDRTQQLFYTNSGVLQYACYAPSSVPVTTVSVADGSLVNIAVTSSVGTVSTTAIHGLWIGARVTITGSTTSLNGTYTVTGVPTTNQYTIATTAVADGTYTTGVKISTNSPKLDSPVWFVSVLAYDSSGNLTSSYPGGGALSLNYRAKCSDRALY